MLEEIRQKHGNGTSMWSAGRCAQALFCVVVFIEAEDEST